MSEAVLGVAINYSLNMKYFKYSKYKLWIEPDECLTFEGRKEREWKDQMVTDMQSPYKWKC